MLDTTVRCLLSFSKNVSELILGLTKPLLVHMNSVSHIFILKLLGVAQVIGVLLDEIEAEEEPLAPVLWRQMGLEVTGNNTESTVFVCQPPRCRA